MIKYSRYFILSVMLLAGQISFAQVPNDECIFGTYLGLVDEYCSGQNAFTNSGATPSADALPACIFGNGTNDVWFSFVPTAPAAYISVNGNLSNPSVVIYEGNCTNLVDIGCNSAATGVFTEISATDLVIGQVYYLRIDARNDQTGTFELCIRSFSPTLSPESDCPDAVVLCDKSPFQVENLNQTGNIQNEMTGSCIIVGTVNGQQVDQREENGSVWYVWTCDQSGTLEFTLDPNNPDNDEEDLDFVVYELPGGIRDCDNRISLRCMLSGESQGMVSSPCYGPTGLRAGETDFQEFAGCADGSNNFVAPLDMESGKSYGLIVNNFSQSGFGFSIEFGGSGTFLGPEADFVFEVVGDFECDKTIIFTDNSESLTDPITNYKWNFGAGSSPNAAQGPGPHATIYESFGDKLAALTVQTSRGCQVTYIEEFFIEPCCDDLPPLVLDGVATDVSCFGDEDGTILAEGSNGQPQYQYSIDGVNFQPSPLFINLPAGDFPIYVQDIKGCEGETVFTIEEPVEIIVDAGQDTIVDLGFSIILDGDYSPMKTGDSIAWTPLDGFVNLCDGCLDPEIIPPGTTTYTLTVIDENGCSSDDEITLRVNVVRPIHTPNIFSPNGDRSNDRFNLFGGPAVRSILSLKVFDRWGNLVYDGTPAINERDQGWDGMFNNVPVENGVYAWIAQIDFIDNMVLPYSGDVTVIR